MTFIYLLLVSFFLYNIDCVSSVVYSCDRNADCGCSKTNAELNKIVGGESAVDSSWGWAVSLRRISDNGHFCGGAIISPLHIITAAHCLKNVLDIPRNVKVVVGINRLSDAGSSMAQERSIVRAFSHPAYDDVSKANDIAILRLNQSLNISNEKGTARLCLAHVIPTDTANNYPFPDSSLIAIGWGVLTSGSQSIPNDQHLQQVTLKAISAEHRMCAPSLNNRQLQFCAGVIGGGKDTCQGDSGGPLMYFDANERRWILAGITSYGRGCGLPEYAGVYTRASVYRDWLQSIVTDPFVELSVNGTSLVPLTDTSTNGPSTTRSTSTASVRSILSSYWLFPLSLYTFARMNFHDKI